MSNWRIRILHCASVAHRCSFPPRIFSELSICYAIDSARESRLKPGCSRLFSWVSISSIAPHLLPGKIEFTISADLVANTDKRVSLNCSLLALLLLRHFCQKGVDLLHEYLRSSPAAIRQSLWPRIQAYTGLDSPERRPICALPGQSRPSIQ